MSNITRITHTHRNGVNGAVLQCAAIQTALLTDDKPSAERLETWTDGFLSKLLERMKKHEAQPDAVPPYVIYCLVLISLFCCIVATVAADCFKLL